MKDYLYFEFSKLYGQDAVYSYFSPGRVNLIGEHIDYNGGLVMPCAITFGTSLLIAPNTDHLFRFRSLNIEDHIEIPVQDSYSRIDDSWYNFPLGIIAHCLRDGHAITGMDFLFSGDIPIGAGLSSSASVEIVTAFALNEILKLGYSKLDLVKLSKSVENDFIGVNSGIMDQFAVAFGEKNKALMLNCDTLEYRAVDTNLGDHVLAIINTNKPRKLSESKYNERVIECNQALVALQQKLKINYLCDVDATAFTKYSYLITDEVIYKRAKHVIQENERVKLAAVALTKSDLAEFGRLMYASHDSLRDLYEVSGIELDTIEEYAKTDPNVIGARMTGAGFGGCAIALVKKDSFQDFGVKVSAYYAAKIGYAPSVYSSLIGDGVSILKDQEM